MEVLSCSDVQYVGESNCPQRATGTNFLYNENQMEHGKEAEVSDIAHKVDGEVVNAEWSKKGGLVEEKEGVYLGTSYSEHMEEGEALTCSLNSQKQNDEPCIASKISLNVKNIEGELPSCNKDRESHLPEAEWLEPDETVALWVKWRGKWQAGIRCARADCPLSTLKARPTHDRKKYFVVFFPQTRNYSWADTLLVRPIHEFPEPIAHRTHKRGRDKVKDLSLPRRFIIQKLAIGMLNVSDQLHNEAVIESAREVTAWKEFAMEASRCKVYQDLGKMLLKLHNMILKQYVYPDWLENSFDSWTKRCQNAPSAESIETLKEEMVNSIMWNEVEALWDAPVQPELGSEWKTWKQEAMKWFSTSHPIASVTNVEQRLSGNSESIGQQTSRKRAKLVVRRAEMHASQVEVGTLHETLPQTNIVEIDSGYFNSQGGIEMVTTSVSDPCNTERAAPSASPSSVTNRWDGIVVEVENSRLNRTTGVEEMPGDGGSSRKLLNPGNKYRQCMAFIEAKGRQCVRWANEDDVYCCVHLPTRSFGKAANAEQTPTKDSPMCEGTTTHGTKCKHRSRYGSSFCKKHGLHESQYLMDIKKQSSSPGNTLKRKHIETIPSTETALGKEIVLFQDGQMPIQENSVSLVELENLDERNSIQVYNNSEALQCIGPCNENNNAPCLDPAKLHSLYCEKHLPSWLKRARNGKSRIISKEVFTDLLRNCGSQKQKLHLHQACGLLYGFIKSILSRRNPLSKETQIQWILSEASNDLCVGECLLKLVSREREKLMMLWGFDIDKVKPISSAGVEQSVLVPVVCQNSNNIQNVVKCKICTGEFLDDQSLGSHWMDIHKKEAQRLYRGYACALCMDSFTDKKVLETHVMVKHEMQYLEQCILFQCIPCGSHFMNPSQLWSHVLTVHSKDFKLPTVAEEHIFSANQVSTQLELGNNSSERNSESKGAGRFICRFCGLKFDLLPDLGRHHQAAHMSLTSINHIFPKRGTHVNPFKLKSGKLSHPSFTKGLGVATASYRIRNRNRSNLRLKKRFRASNSVSTVGLRIQTQVAEEVGLGRLAESQCSSVAKILFSEIQKTKPHPNNLDILSVARSTCCKISLQAALEKQYGVLPERLYLKAAKLCSELNIQVTWHKEGFICPKGCKLVKDSNTLSPLMPLPIGSMELALVKIDDPMNIEEWEMDEGHYIIESRHIKSRPMSILLCEDVSFGRESVPVTCAVDDNVVGSINGFIKEGSNGKITGFPVPWEGFTYVTERLLDPSLGLDTKSSQLGCACPHLTCSPEACDHVYLFDNDYENAEDIDGQPMHGRFPYDERGRIVLKEGYLVYECNSLCSCDRTCRNRVLQNGMKVKLEVFKTDNKGWAVRAGEAILRGSFVCEYIGEVINDQEASNRGVRLDNEGCSYLYDINAHIDVLSELNEGMVSYLIDATRYGNVSRFMNHSCSPNLASYLVLVENMDHQLAHIGFYASRDIAKGEELAYDYGRKLQTGQGHPCCCGAPNCRGLY